MAKSKSKSKSHSLNVMMILVAYLAFVLTNMGPNLLCFKVLVATNDIFASLTFFTTPPPVHIMNLATAYQQSEIAYALTKSGIIDALSSFSSPTPTSCTSIAAELSLDPEFTCRVMSAGTSSTINLLKLSSTSPPSFTLTPSGELLTSAHPSSSRNKILMLNEETKVAWHELHNSLKSGKSGFVESTGGNFWSHLESNPPARLQFDLAMEAFSVDAVRSFTASFSPHKSDAVVCDIGGGNGSVLAGLTNAWPLIAGFSFDLSIPVSPPAQHDDRIEFLAGSFFDALPFELASCDLFLLKFILHDWSDENCVKILQVSKRSERALKKSGCAGLCYARSYGWISDSPCFAFFCYFVTLTCSGRVSGGD